MKIYVDKLPEGCGKCCFRQVTPAQSGFVGISCAVNPLGGRGERRDDCPLAELPDVNAKWPGGHIINDGVQRGEDGIELVKFDRSTPAIRFAPPRNNTGAE